MDLAHDAETVLIVDDEEPVRRTFREWLEGAALGCTLLCAADAESALMHADRQRIDLAILDWNLGAGNDGLRLLEDLYLFNPDVVAIMVTGFAHQATPLDAMRMGVRDYLDKNQDLTRDAFLRSVRRQLDLIRPARRERQLHRSLVAFREAVDKVLPLARSAAALHDPLPFPDAVVRLFRFLCRTTGAQDGVLLVRNYETGRVPAEFYRAFDTEGHPLDVTLVPFAESLAATVLSLQEPYATSHFEESSGLKWQPFERQRHSLLAAPMAIGPGRHAVLELFDKKGGEPFTSDDRLLLAAAADFGVEMMRQALTERQTHQLLLEAVGAALGASESVTQNLMGTRTARPDDPTSESVMDRLRAGLEANGPAAIDAEDTVRLAEAVRVLAVRHGTPAVRHCLRVIESVRELLDEQQEAEA